MMSARRAELLLLFRLEYKYCRSRSLPYGKFMNAFHFVHCGHVGHNITHNILHSAFRLLHLNVFVVVVVVYKSTLYISYIYFSCFFSRFNSCVMSGFFPLTCCVHRH